MTAFPASPREHSSTPSGSADNADSKQVRAARRALDIIEVVAEARLLKHTDIAARLAIPKSSTTLILDTLVRTGYLRRDPMSRAYSLGSRILGIAGRYLSETDIVQISQPVLSGLVLEIDESCFLVQSEEDEVYVLWREVCRRRLTYTFSLGERAPITHTAGGLAMLAKRDPRSWEPSLVRCGVPPGSERVALLAHLQAIAEGAVAIRAHGLVQEVTSLALTVDTARGLPLAAISVAVPAQRLNDALRMRIEQHLRAARDDIAGQARAMGLQPSST